MTPEAPVQTDIYCVWYGQLVDHDGFEVNPPLPPFYVRLSHEDMTITDPFEVGVRVSSFLSEHLANDPTFARLLAEWIESKR